MPPIPVRGLTLAQIENVIRRAYTIDHQILPVGKERIIVTLMRKRTIQVVVMRQDGGIGDGDTELSTRGQTVELSAYKNDVLNALAKRVASPKWLFHHAAGSPAYSGVTRISLTVSSRSM